MGREEGLFHRLGEWRGANVVRATSSDPLRVEALAIEAPDGGRHVLVACLVPESINITLGGLRDGMARIRMLDLETGPQAMRDPEAFRASGEPIEIRTGRASVALGAYAVARIDAD